MQPSRPITFLTVSILAGVLTAAYSGAALAGAGHSDGDDSHGMVDQMREIHRGHEHGHDFEAMEELRPEQSARVMKFMRDVGIAVPPMDPVRGRKLFAETGCVVCHSVAGVGGDIGPSLDAADMPSPMNAFEFGARMWRGAPAMAAMQEDMLGSVINLSGQDLADLVAFAHDVEEQKKLDEHQIPENFRKLMAE